MSDSAVAASGLTRTAGKVYFPGLNALRALAASIVFLCHVELIKKLKGLQNLGDIYFFKTAGSSGVDLFFCISGFLITYLLLIEKDKLGTIWMKDFYIRRILRIWPLYYFILILTLFVIPYFFHVDGFSLDKTPTIGAILLFVFFSPYIGIALYSVNLMAAVLWSIGVEETYYLFWPWIVKKLSNIKLMHFAMMLAIFVGIKAVVTYAPYKVADRHHFLKHLSDIMSLLRLECMIMGGAFAFMLISESPLVAYIKNTGTFILAIILWLLYLINGFDHFYFGLNPIIAYILNPVLFAALCCIIIVNVTSRKQVYVILENRILSELGQISFGIYVYHIVCIMLVFYLFEKFGLVQSYQWSIPILSYILAVTVAYISYHTFEKRFLRFKKRFTHVVSGQDARSINKSAEEV